MISNNYLIYIIFTTSLLAFDNRITFIRYINCYASALLLCPIYYISIVRSYLITTLKIFTIVHCNFRHVIRLFSISLIIFNFDLLYSIILLWFILHLCFILYLLLLNFIASSHIILIHVFDQTLFNHFIIYLY